MFIVLCPVITKEASNHKLIIIVAYGLSFSCLIVFFPATQSHNPEIFLAPVPERPIDANPGLKILLHFGIYLPTHHLE